MDLVWCVWLWLIERAHATGIRSASSASWLGFHLFLTCSFLQRAGGSRWRWRCPAAFWPSDSRASTWPRCGQSCTLIRLGSSLLSFLRSPGLSMFSGPLRPLSPPWLPGWASPGGYICLQQLYSRLFTGNQQGGVLTTTKASPHTCPLYPLRSGCGEKEGGWLWGGQDPPAGWNEERGFCSFVAGWGSVSGDRTADGRWVLQLHGLRHLSGPWATAGSLNSAGCVQHPLHLTSLCQRGLSWIPCDVVSDPFEYDRAGLTQRLTAVW